MSRDFYVTGADQFGRLARHLKEAGDKELRSELYKGINRAVKPIRRDVKNNLGTYMPQRYADVLKPSLRLTVGKKTGARSAGIALKGRARGQAALRDLKPLDSGKLRHPLFGNRKHWKVTRIKRGFFSEQVHKHADTVRRDISNAMDDVSRKIARNV